MRRVAIIALGLFATALVGCGGRSSTLPPDTSTLTTAQGRLSRVTVSFSVPPGSGTGAGAHRGSRRPLVTSASPSASVSAASGRHRNYIDYVNTAVIAISVSQAPGFPPVSGFSAQQAQLQLNCPSASAKACIVSANFQLPSAVPLLFVVSAFDGNGNSLGGTSVTDTLAPGLQSITLTLGGGVATLALSISPTVGVAGTPQTIALTVQTATDPDGAVFRGPFATPVPVMDFLNGGYPDNTGTALAPITSNGQPYTTIATSAFPGTGSTATLQYTGLFDGQDAILDVVYPSDPPALFTAPCPPATTLCAYLVTPSNAHQPTGPPFVTSRPPGNLASYHGTVYLTDNDPSIVAFDPASGNQTRLSSNVNGSAEPSAGASDAVPAGTVLAVIDGNGVSVFNDATKSFGAELPFSGTCQAPASSATLGQDGNVWYGGGSSLFAISPAGNGCSSYALASGDFVSAGESVAAAGNSIWFLDAVSGQPAPGSYGYIPYNAPANSPTAIADVEKSIAGPGGPEQLAGITKGPDGNIWITDSQLPNLYKIDAQAGSPTYGTLLATYTIPASAGLAHPALTTVTADTVNSSDSRFVYFADQGDSVLGRLNVDTGAFTFLTPKYLGPTSMPFANGTLMGSVAAIAFDGTGKVYVTDIAAGIDGSGNSVGVANVSGVSSPTAALRPHSTRRRVERHS